MVGGTTFRFVTDRFDAALQHTCDAAGDGVVHIAGGTSTVRQALASGAVDERIVDVIPVVLGRGEPLFAGLDDLTLTPAEVAHSPHATHIRYRVIGPRTPASRWCSRRHHPAQPNHPPRYKRAFVPVVLPPVPQEVAIDVFFPPLGHL